MRARDREQIWHTLEVAEAARRLGVDLAAGLSDEEVVRRQAEHGPNVVSARPGTPAWRRFLLQFKQPLIYILLAAVVITGAFREWVDFTVIAAVVITNAVVGFIQESKASKAIEALSRMIVTEATVRRGGGRVRVPSREIVPGDVVLLQAGDLVPADVRLVRAKGLQIDEAPLTGESVPVEKHLRPLPEGAVLADRRNLAFAGTLVTSGRGEGVVFEIGDRTETGHIAQLISQSVEIVTPLTRKIERFSRLVLWVILTVAAVAFALGVVRGEPIVDGFMVAVAIAVGAIPEGLPAAVTVVLAMGVSRMAKRRAVIRKLPAVETLGGTTVICSDKTGTLTENQMTVQRLFAGGELFEVSGTGYDAAAGAITKDGAPIDAARSPALVECLRAGVLCNDSRVVVREGRHVVLGDPTEAALLVAGAKAGVVHADALDRAPRRDMIPFESEHMFRATLHDVGGDRVIYKVGAVERLLERCTDMLDAEGGLAPLDAARVRAVVERMAGDGLRVLAFARRHGGHVEGGLEHDHVREGLTFLGLQGMIDPPRAEALEAVVQCRRAGIAVKMITGDHATTARAIALRIGLAPAAPDGELRVVTGQELAAIADAALPDVADATAVFARVAPEQKLRLVRALQAKGHVVAMTGDGVNDAPALKQADIGIAMGITGTDVAKGAADMILTDDDFASIRAAVEEGRAVFDNLLKFIVWTLPTNLGETCIVMLAVAFGLPLPLSPSQLLWINLGTSLFLGLTLVFEPKERGLMERRPRDPRRPLLTYPLVMRTGLVSLVMVAGAFWVFFRELEDHDRDLGVARTAVVNVMVVVETTYLFGCRSLSRSVLSVGLASNPLAVGGAVAMIATQAVFTYASFMHATLRSRPIGLDTWLHVALVGGIAVLVVELEKWIRFGGGRGREAVPE